MPAKVDQSATALARQCELPSQRCQLVGGVERAGAREARQELRGGHDYFVGMTVPQRLQVRASRLP
jgi:hypothetical protein